MTADEIRAALAEAQKLVTAGAKWEAWAWTPARCYLWNAFDADRRAWLEKWVHGEPERWAKMSPEQLIEIRLEGRQLPNFRG